MTRSGRAPVRIEPTRARVTYLNRGDRRAIARHYRASGPTHARTSLLSSPRRMVTLSGVAAGLITAAAVSATVIGGPAGVAPRAVAQPAAAPKTSPLVNLAAQAGETGPLLSAADLARLRAAAAGVPAAARPGRGVGRRDASPVSSLASDGIPATALLAYEQAAAREAERNPACGITWPLLAGIGRVESDHGRFAGATLHSDGLSTPEVIGIALDGHGTALIRDTDGGRLDGDTVYDRAVGPMQFIPSTWAGWGVDANHDGVKDPFNIFDAAAASADYLCAAGRDLTTSRGQVQAILSYNYSYDYVSMVMGLERVYAHGVGITVPVLPTAPDQQSGPPKTKPPLPPVDPGKPRGAPAPGDPSSPTPGGSTGLSDDPTLVPTAPPVHIRPGSSGSSSGSGSDNPTSPDPSTEPPAPTDVPGDSPTPSGPLSGSNDSVAASSEIASAVDSSGP
jgi:membrane-bound lytic murein transglycosylase B